MSTTKAQVADTDADIALESSGHATGTIDKRGIGFFLALAFGIAWLLWAVLWLAGQGPGQPWFLPVVALSMFAPAVAAFITVRWISPVHSLVTATGLRPWIKGTRPVWYYLTAILAMPLFVIGALFVGAALGLYQMDLTNYSAYRAALEAAGVPQDQFAQIPIAVLVWLQIATLPILGLINIPVTFGEEYGWRGYLLPALLPLGQWPALIVHGVIWGFWHAPLILMGYNYPQHPILGVFAMVGFTTILGIIFGWLLLATGSVWPAVIAHSEINAAAGLVMLLAQQGTTVDTLHATILGWSGWILPLLFIGFLVLTKRLPVRGTLALNNTSLQRETPQAG